MDYQPTIEPLDMPNVRSFILGQKLFTYSSTIEPYYFDDENGNRRLNFGKNGRARILDALWAIPVTELSDDMVDQLYEAIQDLGYFMKDICIWYEAGAHKLLPHIEYKTFKPENAPFYPNPKDPAFVHYRNQIVVHNQLARAGRPIPDELLSYLEQMESTFFLGSENERKRAKIMDEAIKRHLASAPVQWAIFSVLYTPEEFNALYKKYIRPAELSEVNKSKGIEKEASSVPFRVSGHFYDQTLKYQYPPDIQSPTVLFESLSGRTKTQIINAGISIETIVEGVPLTPSENKLIISLCKILARQSQVADPTNADYFAGRSKIEDVVDYGETKEIAPKIFFTLYELTKEYSGGRSPSGKEIANVKAILNELVNKQYLISYIQTTSLFGGKQRKETVEGFMPLVRILKYTNVTTDSEGAENSRTEEVLVRLNPIFKHKIDAKFIEVPGDLNRRTMIAYGSYNVSDATIRLRDYLLREKSSSRHKVELGLDRLYYLLCEKWMREGRRKKVTGYTDKAIEANIALGLITKYDKLPSKTDDGEKIVFHLNKKFPEV